MRSVNARNTPDLKKKNKIKQNLTKNESNLLILNYHLVRNARILTLDKLKAREIYSVLILSLKNKPTSQKYFETLFPNYTFEWKQIYLLPRIITINSYQHNFQYKILHNTLDLNKKLYIFCFFCHSNCETVAHRVFLRCMCQSTMEST